MNWNHEETLKTFFSSMVVIYTSDKPKPTLVLIFWTTVDVAFLKYKYIHPSISGTYTVLEESFSSLFAT